MNPEAKSKLIYATELIHRFDKGYRFRWDVWNDMIQQRLHTDTIWVDAGCGENEHVRAFGQYAAVATGVDVLIPRSGTERFLQGDIHHLPFADSSTDLVTLRYVVEHLPTSESLNDIARITKPGGELLFITTNIWCPFIAVARLLPFRMKTWLIQRVFGVDDNDVFPTYHPLNTPRAVRNATPLWECTELHLIADINYHRRVLLWGYILYHLLTTWFNADVLRHNIIAVYKRRDTPIPDSEKSERKAP